ncbi:unnamed protein product [Cylicocyclus nassatus]|uniref:Uncharacterized protein n=1 Tax=Cylicocyclus nassatus TaxID=53992 RepID=A0AA36GK33_CYLNA|nr:unnamed protein product [Cylicocyclus nassatus]
MVQMGDEEETEQKNIILSALVPPPERKISRISLRKISAAGEEEYVDVPLDPFPALPINIRVPSMRKKSIVDETTQSTTNILKNYVKHEEEDRLKQWERLEVLPDTDATAALAQLVLDHKESIKEDDRGNKKVFVPIKRNLKRTTSLDWSEKLFKLVTKPKLRYISQMNCEQISLNLRDMNAAKENLRTVSAALEKKNFATILKDLTKGSINNEKKPSPPMVSVEPPVEAVVVKPLGAPPSEPTTAKTTLQIPQESSRKLTPMPKDVSPLHPVIKWIDGHHHHHYQQQHSIPPTKLVTVLPSEINLTDQASSRLCPKVQGLSASLNEQSTALRTTLYRC